ncbi:MAG: tetratricopeptide repeat protein [Elusimicrobia bacterium]|nr:tetratricopeptide repeat protein [Elusimicrobiota bacterium]
MERLKLVLFAALIFGGCQKAYQHRQEAAKKEKALALELIDKKEWKQAERHLEKASKEDPWDADIWHNLGVCYAEGLNRPQWARDMFKKALELNPGHALAHYGMGLLEWEKNWNLANASFVAAYKLDPVSVGPIENYYLQHALAGYFLSSGYFYREVAARDIIARIYPDWVEKQLDLGDALVRAGQYALAVEVYQRVIAGKDKEKAKEAPYIGLAWALMNMNDLNAAAKALEQAWKINHKNGLLRYYAGLLARRTGDRESALNHLNVAAIGLKDGRGLIALADLHLEMGHHRAAEEYLDLADRRYADDPMTQYELMLFYERQGNGEEALRHGERAAKANAGNWRYACALQGLLIRLGHSGDEWTDVFEACRLLRPLGESL